LAGVATFLLQGIHPRTWWEEKKAQNTSRWAMIVWIALLVLFAFLIWIWGIYHG
jgi:cell division septal protein FtsQ